jgi:uncharacterized protein (DUF2132 family)
MVLSPPTGVPQSASKAARSLLAFARSFPRVHAAPAPYHMHRAHSNDPLHGVTLEVVIKSLVETYGWPELGDRIPIRCFTHNPSVKSSLTFLRKTPWARTKVEQLYVRSLPRVQADPMKEAPTERDSSSA